MKTFAEFWPFYLGEHAKPATRWLHFVGSTVGLGFGVAAVVYRSWAFVPGAFLSGYAFAWVSHYTIEKNHPATFKHPLWSFLGDWKMWALMITGRIDGELKRLGLPSAS